MLARAAVSLALVLGSTACSCHASHADPHAQSASAQHTVVATGQHSVLLASQKRARVRVIVPARVFDVEPEPPKLPKGAPKSPPRPRLTLQEQRALVAARKLQAAARDLAHYLSLLSGSEVVTVRAMAAPEPGIVPIWLAEDAQQRF